MRSVVGRARDLHYGSRASRGTRFTLVLHYTTFGEYASSNNTPYNDLDLTIVPELHERFARTPLQRLAYRSQP